MHPQEDAVTASPQVSSQHIDKIAPQQRPASELRCDPHRVPATPPVRRTAHVAAVPRPHLQHAADHLRIFVHRNMPFVREPTIHPRHHQYLHGALSPEPLQTHCTALSEQGEDSQASTWYSAGIYISDISRNLSEQLPNLLPSDYSEAPPRKYHTDFIPTI